jgi:integrase
MRKSYPFSVFKRADRPCYSVSFKDDNGKYITPISTKKKNESEAIETAFQWLKDGVPRKKGKKPVKIQQFTLMEMAKKADLTRDDAEFIANELKRRGILKNFVLADSKQDIELSEYLMNFWDFDNSGYIRERLRKNHGIHKRYCREQQGVIRKYWLPYFKNKLLGEVDRANLEEFMDWFSEKTNFSQQWKNNILRAGTIGIRWAFGKGIIDKDITSNLVWFSGNRAERQILTPELVKAVFQVDWKDNRSRLANLLAMVTGLRAGEIQGLRVQDLGQDCLYIRHSWNCIDGLKPPKNNESRRVEVPFPGVIRALLDMAKSNPHGQSMDSYVFWAEKCPDKPMEAVLFLKGLRQALKGIGIGEGSVKDSTFHAWRHYFTAYMQGKVDEKILQRQTGHKSIVMLRHYADHGLPGDSRKVRQAQLETFGELVPDIAPPVMPGIVKTGLDELQVM